MRRPTRIGLLCLLAAPVPSPAAAQARSQGRPAASALNCRLCHTGATPTKADPALIRCPRLLIKDYHSVDDAPPTMTLGSSAGRYGPVAFSHREHARMAGMDRGCEGCHHYDQARPIQKCDGCHSATRLRTDLARPDLKAAMHRQCFDCHRDWNPGVTCLSCHGATTGAATARTPVRPAGLTKPKAPIRVIYRTPAAAGRTVTFFHNEHVDRFGLACADCHQGASCASCHRAPVSAVAEVSRAAPAGRPDSLAHARCSACHANDRCATCHSDQPPRTAGFDHRARTGWGLNRFHASLPCQACHVTEGAFRRLNPDCESCHAGWQKRFAHGKTGLALDELHAGLDCTSCHPDKTFRGPPACADCHSDKSYPAARPGQSVPPASRRP